MSSQAQGLRASIKSSASNFWQLAKCVLLENMAPSFSFCEVSSAVSFMGWGIHSVLTQVNLLLKLQFEKRRNPISSAPKWIYSSGKISMISSNNNFKAANDLPCSIHISGMNAQVLASYHYQYTQSITSLVPNRQQRTAGYSGQLHALIVLLHTRGPFRWEHIRHSPHYWGHIRCYSPSLWAVACSDSIMT